MEPQFFEQKHPPELEAQPRAIRAADEHQLDRVATAIFEELVARRDAIVASLTMPSGRQVGTRPLSDMDVYRRYQDPGTRQEITQEILQREGPVGLRRYFDHIALLEQKLMAGKLT